MDPSQSLRVASVQWYQNPVQLNEKAGPFDVRKIPNDLAVLIASKLLCFSDPVLSLKSLYSFALSCRRCYLIRVELFKHPEFVSSAILAIIQSVYFNHKPIGIGPTDKHRPLKYYSDEQSCSIDKFILQDRLKLAWNQAGNRIESLIATGAIAKQLPLKGLKSINIHSRLSTMSTVCPALNDLDLRNTRSLDVGMQIHGFNRFFESTLLLKLSQTILGQRNFRLTLNQMSFTIPEKQTMNVVCRPMLQLFDRSWMDRPAWDEWLFVHGGLTYCTHVSQPDIVFPWDFCEAENTWLPRITSSQFATNLVGLRLTSLGEDSISRLLAWPRLTHLSSLYLFLNKFDQISEVSRLFLTKQLPALTTLKLDTLPVQQFAEEDPADALVISICNSAQNLKKFSMGAIFVSGFSLQTILLSMTHLRRLEVRSYEPLSQESVALLEDEKLRYRLECMSLLDHSLTKDIVKLWKEKGITFPSVRKMTLNGRELDDEAIDIMLGIFPSLTNLNLGRTSGEPRTISGSLLQRSVSDLKKNGLSRKNDVAALLHPAPMPTLVPLNKKKCLPKVTQDKL